MGSCLSATKPQELTEFRKLNPSTENVEIPTRPENRTVTDKKLFIIFGVVLVLLPFLIYGLVKSDLRHLDHLTDDCGNFCGVNNTRIEGIHCSGKNYSDQPYWDKDLCTASCERANSVTPYQGSCEQNKYIVFHQYHKPDFDFVEALFDYHGEAWSFFSAILLTIAFSLLTRVALIYKPVVVVWIILVLAIIILGIPLVWWWFYNVAFTGGHLDWPLKGLSLIGASVGTLLIIVILITIIILRKKISLSIQLFKEANKVVIAMPLLAVVTLLTIVVQIVILRIFYATSFRLLLAMDLYKTFRGYEYSYSSLTVFINIANIVITIWALHFVAGIQYMIIAGTVARWFFAKNKEYLDSPILTSTKVVLKYHLGTVVFGSSLFMLFSTFRGIIKVVFKIICCSCSATCCRCVDFVLYLISENSYVETAIHGQSYWKSAKRATNLLLSNAKSVIAIHCIGDFIMVAAVLVVSPITTAITLGIILIDRDGVVPALNPLIVLAIGNITIVSMSFAAFQAIIDTLLVCLCEDSLLNDGVSRPYHMPRGLMEFLENSKKMYEENTPL